MRGPAVLAPQPEDRIVSVLPLHHAFEFTAGLLGPLAAGSLVTHVETPSSESILGALRHDAFETWLRTRSVRAVRRVGIDMHD